MVCGSRVGHRDVGDARLGALTGQQFGIAAPGGQSDHLEAVGVAGDDLQGLRSDRPGAAEDQPAQAIGGAHPSIVPGGSTGSGNRFTGRQPL